MSIENTLKKAQVEMDKGNLWRAKEIIRSSIGRFGFEPKTNALYGKILLAMSDDMQAGKYLFYGEKHPNEAEQRAIDLFTTRHGNNNEFGLLMAAPVKNEFKVEELPEFIELRLKQFHSMDDAPESIIKLNQSSFSDKLGNLGCSLFFIILLASVVVGFGTIIRWMFSGLA